MSGGSAWDIFKLLPINVGLPTHHANEPTLLEHVISTKFPMSFGHLLSRFRSSRWASCRGTGDLNCNFYVKIVVIIVISCDEFGQGLDVEAVMVSAGPESCSNLGEGHIPTNHININTRHQLVDHECQQKCNQKAGWVLSGCTAWLWGCLITGNQNCLS